MKKIAAIVLAAAWLAGCGQTNKGQGQTEIVTVNTAEEVIDVLSTDLQLIDVRTPAEYSAGHIKNATLINIQDPDFESKMDQMNKEKPVMVYCAVGGRSSRAVALIQDLGFSKVYNYKGGMKDWSASGMEMETSQ
ncbi:MAG: rhodanese-like domain-containing protein [Cyclobacteriaceae bacterium]